MHIKHIYSIYSIVFIKAFLDQYEFYKLTKAGFSFANRDDILLFSQMLNKIRDGTVDILCLYTIFSYSYVCLCILIFLSERAVRKIQQIGTILPKNNSNKEYITFKTLFVNRIANIVI